MTGAGNAASLLFYTGWLLYEISVMFGYYRDGKHLMRHKKYCAAAY